MRRHESPVLAVGSVVLLVAAWTVWGVGIFATPMDAEARAAADLPRRLQVNLGIVFPYYVGCVAAVVAAPLGAFRLWPMWCTSLAAALLLLHLGFIGFEGGHAFRLFPSLGAHLEIAIHLSWIACVTALGGTILAEVRPRAVPESEERPWPTGSAVLPPRPSDPTSRSRRPTIRAPSRPGRPRDR